MRYYISLSTRIFQKKLFLRFINVPENVLDLLLHQVLADFEQRLYFRTSSHQFNSSSSTRPTSQPGSQSTFVIYSDYFQNSLAYWPNYICNAIIDFVQRHCILNSSLNSTANSDFKPRRSNCHFLDAVNKNKCLFRDLLSKILDDQAKALAPQNWRITGEKLEVDDEFESLRRKREARMDPNIKQRLGVSLFFFFRTCQKGLNLLF